MTRTISILSLVFLLACGSSPPATVPDAAAPLPAHYRVRSSFDVASNMPGDVGAALNELFDATDDPSDPALFLVQLVIAKMPDGPAKTIATGAAPYLAAYLNTRLLAIAPQLVVRVLTVARELGQAARSLGPPETLDIASDGASATHAITGVRYTLDNVDVELPFDAYSLPDVTAAVGIQTSPGALAIGSHAMALSYGRLLRMTLDHAIVPRVDPGAVDLLGLLQNAVDCAAVGDAIAAGLGVGDATTYATACRDGLTLAATAIYDDLAHVDSEQLVYTIAGQAHVADFAGNETLADGVWTGTLDYGPARAPLGSATFTGTREEVQPDAEIEPAEAPSPRPAAILRRPRATKLAPSSLLSRRDYMREPVNVSVLASGAGVPA